QSGSAPVTPRGCPYVVVTSLRFACARSISDCGAPCARSELTIDSNCVIQSVVARTEYPTVGETPVRKREAYDSTKHCKPESVPLKAGPKPKLTPPAPQASITRPSVFCLK